MYGYSGMGVHWKRTKLCQGRNTKVSIGQPDDLISVREHMGSPRLEMCDRRSSNARKSDVLDRSKILVSAWCVIVPLSPLEERSDVEDMLIDRRPKDGGPRVDKPPERVPVALRMMLGRFDNGYGGGCSTWFGGNLLVLSLGCCIPHTTKETRSTEAFLDPRRTHRSIDAFGLQAYRRSVHVRGHARFATMTMDDPDGTRLG